MVRGVISIVVLALAVAFLALNWSALSAPMTLSLGFASVQASPGLLMLALLAVLGALFAAWAMSMLAESHHQARELQTQRELADKAEASRFTELRGVVHDELRRLSDDMRITVEQNANTLSAQLGALEDRLEHRALPGELPRGEARAVPPRG
jgi:hypothetical protein